MAEPQRTLLLVKPDGVQRQLVGRVLTRFEDRGLKIVGLKLVHVDRALAEEHYAVHRTKPFFRGLVDFITSGPLVAAALEGPNAIAIVRAMNGATRPHEAAPGSIRGDFAVETAQNLVHASDSPENAAAELASGSFRRSCSTTSARSIAGCSPPPSRPGARSLRDPALSPAAIGQAGPSPAQAARRRPRPRILVGPDIADPRLFDSPQVQERTRQAWLGRRTTRSVTAPLHAVSRADPRVSHDAERRSGGASLGNQRATCGPGP